MAAGPSPSSMIVAILLMGDRKPSKLLIRSRGRGFYVFTKRVTRFLAFKGNFCSGIHESFLSKSPQGQTLFCQPRRLIWRGTHKPPLCNWACLTLTVYAHSTAGDSWNSTSLSPGGRSRQRLRSNMPTSLSSGCELFTNASASEMFLRVGSSSPAR